MESATHDKATINRAKLDELRAFPARADRPSLLVRMIGLFRQEAEELLDRLRRAVDSDDAAEVREAAHKFKSVAGNVGAEALAEMCAHLEMLGLERRMAGAADLLAQVRDEHRRVTEALAVEAPHTSTP